MPYGSGCSQYFQEYDSIQSVCDARCRFTCYSSHRIGIVVQVVTCLELRHHEGLWVDHAFAFVYMGPLGH